MTGSENADYGSGAYRMEKVETDAGTFVEIYDSDVSDEEPAAFLPAKNAVEMAKTVLGEFGVLEDDSR